MSVSGSVVARVGKAAASNVIVAQGAATPQAGKVTVSVLAGPLIPDPVMTPWARSSITIGVAGEKRSDVETAAASVVEAMHGQSWVEDTTDIRECVVFAGEEDVAEEGALTIQSLRAEVVVAQ